MQLTGKDRLIVALDVPTAADALGLVEQLEGIASFFKIGWQLFIGGEWKELLGQLGEKRIFIDLKLPGDIGNTIRSVVEACAGLGCVEFLTLSASVTTRSIEEARAGRGSSDQPKLLVVPYLSSLDERDFAEMSGRSPGELDAYMRERAGAALEAGCDGLIASGKAISMLKDSYPRAIIVSPGIRPEGFPADDHKRLSTPREAILLGADYLVVGRPIRNQPTRQDRCRLAEEIIAEIDTALEARSRTGPGGKAARPGGYSALDAGQAV